VLSKRVVELVELTVRQAVKDTELAGRVELSDAKPSPIPTK